VDATSSGKLQGALRDRFPNRQITLTPAATQGNHLAWEAAVDDLPMFLRIENGSDGDDHLEMESAVLREVANAGVRVPEVHAVDVSRSRVSFAWQALEKIPFPILTNGTRREASITRALHSTSASPWRAGSHSASRLRPLTSRIGEARASFIGFTRAMKTTFTCVSIGISPSWSKGYSSRRATR